MKAIKRTRARGVTGRNAVVSIDHVPVDVGMRGGASITTARKRVDELMAEYMGHAWFSATLAREAHVRAAEPSMCPSCGRFECLIGRARRQARHRAERALGEELLHGPVFAEWSTVAGGF